MKKQQTQKRTLTDLSQLTKAMFKAAPKVDEVKPEPPKAKPHDEGEEVLAYFSRSTNVAPGASAASGAEARVEALTRENAALRTQLREAEAKGAANDREREQLAANLASARKEVERLKGECGRLQGEAAKATRAAAGATEGPCSGATAPAPATAAPMRGILAPPLSFAEVFPGEMREMVLAALSDARDAARQSTRERRATVLDAVLAVNKSSGELERRRAELKQALKDCGYYTDPKALERLGLKLISGRTHWKLEYGNIRLPIAKTPSDYRAAINMSTDLANRCF